MDLEQLSVWAREDVQMLLNVLPEDLQSAAAKCIITYESEPGEEEELEEGVLGLFEGGSLMDEASPDAMPRIRIFVGNLWDYTEGDEQDFRDQVGTTFLHELGHYIGWDEDDVADRGLE